MVISYCGALVREIASLSLAMTGTDAFRPLPGAVPIGLQIHSPFIFYGTNALYFPFSDGL